MYDNQSCDFENHEEMKTLRASPLGNGSREKRTEADVSQDVHPDVSIQIIYYLLLLNDLRDPSLRRFQIISF